MCYRRSAPERDETRAPKTVYQFLFGADASEVERETPFKYGYDNDWTTEWAWRLGTGYRLLRLKTIGSCRWYRPNKFDPPKSE